MKFPVRLLNPIYVARHRKNIWQEVKSLFQSSLKPSRWEVSCATRGFPMTPDHKRLHHLKDIHRGKTAFLIGNGPSVRMEDLEKLKNQVTFACNRFHLAYDKTSLRPTYTLSADRQMIGDFGQEILEKTQGTVFFINIMRPEVKGDFIWLRLKNNELSLKNSNIYDFVVPGGATLVAAVQIGFFMGIRKFVLYGVDHSFKFTKDENAKDVYQTAKGEGNHFIPNYRAGKNWCPPSTQLIEDSFIRCRRDLEELGGSIVNATRGGHLEVLPRANFDEIVKSLT
jgi:hypothetical protein